MTAKIQTESLRRLGRKSLSRESLTTALRSLREYDMGGFSVTHSAKSHEGSRYTDLTTIGRGGQFIR